MLKEIYGAKITVRHEATHDEVKAAFHTWWGYHDMTYGSAVREFYKFTGIYSFLSDRHLVSEEQLRRIKFMAGPHGHALLAAHFAREGSDG